MEEDKNIFMDVLDSLDRKILDNNGQGIERLPLQIEIPGLDDLEKNPYAE